MNIIINDINILSALTEIISSNDMDFMRVKFHTILSALESHQRKDAKELETAGVLTFVKLDEKPEETEWMWRNYSGGVCFDELAFLRFAMIHKFTFLTNDPVLTSKAESLGVKVVDVNFIKEEMEDCLVADDGDTAKFLARIFRHHPDHWKWFKNKHLNLERVAVLL